MEKNENEKVHNYSLVSILLQYLYIKPKKVIVPHMITASTSALIFQQMILAGRLPCFSIIFKSHLVNLFPNDVFISLPVCDAFVQAASCLVKLVAINRFIINMLLHSFLGVNSIEHNVT